jgi:hypothetical protein
MRHRTSAAAAVLLALSLSAAACSGDDDDTGSADESTTTTGESAESSDSGGHDRADYIALLGGGGNGFTDEQAQCMAGVLVDTIGVESLEASGAFDKILADPDGDLTTYGVALDEAQAMVFYQGSNACTDLRAWYVDQLTGGDDPLSPEAAACMSNALDDATFARMWAVSFTQGEEGLNADPVLTAAVDQAAMNCV